MGTTIYIRQFYYHVNIKILFKDIDTIYDTMI